MKEGTQNENNKKKIIETWNKDFYRKKHKVKLNYQNWVEIYNGKAEIIAGVIFKKEKKIVFEIFDRKEYIYILESTLEQINRRQIMEE